MDESCSEYSICGADSCIVLISGENCYWCDVVKTMVEDSLTEYEIPTCVIKEVNITNEPLYDIVTTTLPTVKICRTQLTGLTQDTDLRCAVLKMMSRSCFHKTLALTQNSH